jgi:DNA modification methylase
MQWTTQKRKIQDLVPYEVNPRKMTPEQEQKLIKSLEKFNLAEIPAVNADDTIISGHQRIKVLLSLGRGDELIDVRVPDRQLTDEELKEYNLMANTHAGQWDWAVLDEHFSDFDLDDMGIVLPDYMKMKPKEQETPEIKKEGIIISGDLIEIIQAKSTHRLICGDCGDKDVLDKLMNGRKADMVFTDPPYGVSIGKKNEMLNSFQKAGRNLTSIKDDDESADSLYNILLIGFSNLREICEDHCSYYVTAPQGGSLGMMMMMMMMKDAGLEVRHVLNWVKNSPTFSVGRLDYEYKHEPIFYTWTKKHKFYGNGIHKNSCWFIDKPRSSKLHPTMKPVELVENAILNSSKKGELIVDIYMGSGTSMVAAANQGRVCYGSEISEEYCQKIADRMAQNFSCEILINGIDRTKDIYDRLI